MYRYAALLLFLAAVPVTAQKSESAIEYGFEERVRSEMWDNVYDFNDATDDRRTQLRVRTRLWFSAPLTSNIDFHVGLATETNRVFTPRTPTHFDEVIFETAYVDFKRLFVKGLSLRIGRQNLTKGEGFLLLEGDPWDGSRTVYSNAAVLSYERGGHKLEFMGISNPHADRYLPVWIDRSRSLVEWDETALGTYYTNTSRKDTSLEAYYFYKREFGDRRPATNIQFQPNRHVYTAGGRVVHQLPSHFSATGEFASQWGREHPNTDVRAWGGYAYLKKEFGPSHRHSATAGYWAMSGDDPSTPGTNENWDPLFSRWPKWSELYLYTLLRENGVGYWTNLKMTQAEMVYVPWKPLSVRGTWYNLSAFHPYPGSTQTFSAGTGRGNLYRVRADLVVNQNWRGHILYESLSPGSFYTGHDRAHFFRMEVSYTFAGSKPI